MAKSVINSSNSNRINTYVSLFSSAGIGCYGFKLEGFECVATAELLERRIKVQKHNNKCSRESGYICGDMTSDEVKSKIFNELNYWKTHKGVKELDVLIATPPCQGMSVMNLKKKEDKELKRNSLVVESISMTKMICPRYFIFENVRSFLTTVCQDTDGQFKSIKDAIENGLAGQYNILYRVVNFKEYGSPSSRTRTLVIGVRKDITSISPYELFPDKQNERTLREVIGHLPPLTTMGEIHKEDIYHNYRSFDPIMLPWIDNIPEGGSAFDNTDPDRRPYHIKNGERIYNVQKNGDKYTRQYWDKVSPCIHTRNDQLASQNTIHPKDNRVFSIREVMLMMSVPESFKWTETDLDTLNNLDEKEKIQFLKKEELNIRQNLGEAVPTVIFRQIAKKIAQKQSLAISDIEIKDIIAKQNLENTDNLISYIRQNPQMGFATLSRIAELSNSSREDNEGFYTQENICYTLVKHLPDGSSFDRLNILEPSVGVGNFLPSLIAKYSDVPEVNIDVVDIDENTLRVLRELVNLLTIPQNVRLNFILADTILHNFDRRYDIVIGNPPYKKVTKNPRLLKEYKRNNQNKDTNNLFEFFIEKCISVGRYVSLIVPKSLINSPEFNTTRGILSEMSVQTIIDFGEKGFKGVAIETVAICVDTMSPHKETLIESYITNTLTRYNQTYIMDTQYPYWLIYRNSDFDRVASKMTFGIFNSFRDRFLTKSNTAKKGSIRVLKSRNIGVDSVINIPDYDTYVDSLDGLLVGGFLNADNCVLVPNLTYNPRAIFLPKNCIADGSVAILTLKDKNTTIDSKDLLFYSTDEFRTFYRIARNLGSRSMNIDNNSVFFFGKCNISYEQ